MATRTGRPCSRATTGRARRSTRSPPAAPGASPSTGSRPPLGASRGSFYWHFKDRADLIDAALERWERENTTDLLPELEAVEDPRERLRVLLKTVYEQPTDAIELTLASAGDDPVAGPAFARVTALRMDAVKRIFLDLGLPPEEAADRAWLAYALYIGHHQLGRNPAVAERRPETLDRIMELLAAR